MFINDQITLLDFIYVLDVDDPGSMYPLELRNKKLLFKIADVIRKNELLGFGVNLGVCPCGLKEKDVFYKNELARINKGN